MIAYNKCPGCGLRMGQRKEPAGQLYRCRRCKTVVLHERHGYDSRFTAKPDGAAGGQKLLEIPRV